MSRTFGITIANVVLAFGGWIRTAGIRTSLYKQVIMSNVGCPIYSAYLTPYKQVIMFVIVALSLA